MSVATAAENQVQFVQNSVPETIIDQTAFHETGTDVQTVDALFDTQDHRFAYWLLDGVQQRDAAFRALNPVGFRILAPATATAVYIPETEDTNTNAVPDWYELQFHTQRVDNASADADADGFTLREEYRRDTHPRLADVMTDGGVAFALSAAQLVIGDTNLTTCAVDSTPSGVLESSLIITNCGATLTFDDRYGMSNGHRFAHWTVDGVVQTDAVGRAVGSFSFALQSEAEVVAVYLPETQDANSNGVPDWVELNFYGSSVSNATTDGDADGFDLREEYRRDTHPLLVDVMADGGMAFALSAEQLVIGDTNLTTCAVDSAPPGVLEASLIITNRGTTLTFDDRYGVSNGHRFAHWTLDGVVQTDAVGRAVGGFSFAIESESEVVAVYVPETQDGNSNGVPDWVELNFYGTSVSNTTGDSDSDGFDLREEYRRDTHPLLDDVMADGGMAFALSAEQLVIGDTNLTTCTVNSTPPGVLAEELIITNRGSTLTFDDRYGISNGHRFAHWTVDGMVQTDAVGRAVGGFSFALQSESAVVAVYVPETQDGNSNGVPDWVELHFYGSSVSNATTDGDADSFNLREEYRRDTHPLLDDVMADGGVAFALSPSIQIGLNFFPQIKQVLVNGGVESFFSTTQLGAGTFALGSNSSPALGDWDGDLDLDVFVGGANGQLRVFENAGSPQVLNLVERTTNFAGIASAWTNLTQVCPALGDWSGDGVADLAIGGDTNVITLIQSPASWEGDALTGALRTNLVCSALVRASPAFGDVSGDGWTDLLVLTDAGLVQAYTNTHLPLTPYLLPAFSSNLLGMAVQNATGITTADVNDDGVLDVLISDDSGNIWEFHGE